MPPTLVAAILTCFILAILVMGGRLRRVGREFPSRPRLMVGWLLLWTIIYAAVALPVVMSGEPLPVIDVEDLSLMSLFAGHAGLTMFLLCWWVLRRPIRLSRFLHLEGARFADLIGGARLGMKVWSFTFGIALVAGLVLQLAVGAGETYAGTTIELPEIPDVMLWMVGLPIYGKLLIVLVAMTVEEAFFRAFLQTRIGLLPSSVLFAIAHASYGLPTLMIGVFVVSIIIGRDFAKHGNLARCMLAHGVFDAIQLLIVVPFAIGQLQQMQAVAG